MHPRLGNDKSCTCANYCNLLMMDLERATTGLGRATLGLEQAMMGLGQATMGRR